MTLDEYLAKAASLPPVEPMSRDQLDKIGRYRNRRVVAYAERIGAHGVADALVRFDNGNTWWFRRRRSVVDGAATDYMPVAGHDDSPTPPGFSTWIEVSP